MVTLYDTLITEAISQDERFNEIAQLLVALGRGLHEVGAPAHKVEQMLIQIAERFKVPLQVLALPTGQLLSFHRDEGPMTFVLRMQPGAVNLDRLARFTVIAERLSRGSMTPLAAKARIDKIMSEPARWGAVATVLAYLTSGAAFSVFFGGGWTELAVASCVGLAVGAIAVGMRRVRHPARLFELTAAAAAAFIAGTADWLLGAYGGWIPLASGLIILLPGIALVDSLEELANGHLVAGGARLAGVAVAFMALTFGVVLGYWTADLFQFERDIQPVRLAVWAMIPALLVVAVGSTIRFKASATDWWLILAASAIALVGSRVGTAMIGPESGPFLAALALGVVANLYARWSHRAAELMVVPGLALLVPGSVGYRSLEALLAQKETLGVATAFEMFEIAMAIVAGLLVSDWLVPDRVPG
ncbi:MAG: threonine/serine exporter family protein [Planctomycetia bacterium]|nr:threonine/serine exporter family protein [Planctomycetia bacterium]